MKRKLIILGVATIITCFIFTGCSSKNNSKNNDNKVEDTYYDSNETATTDDDLKLYSDDTKYVFEMGNTKYVFYYSGDKITAYHTYVDYNDVSNAKILFQQLKKEDYPEVKDYYLKGKYIVFEWSESTYENLSASDLKTVYSYMKEVKK